MMLHHKTKLISLLGHMLLIFSLNSVFSQPLFVPDANQVQVKELELRFAFPNRVMAKEEIFLYKPQRISSDKAGHVYISCIGDHRIREFDAEGRFIKTIGRAGQGPGEFQGPNHAYPLKDKLIILDNFSRKFQILDSGGGYLTSFIIKSSYWDFVVSESGLIYAAPLLYPIPGLEKKNLIHIYAQDGEMKSSFGKPKNIDETFFGMVRLAANPKNEILAAFMHWPEIRKYTPEGELIAEYTIDHPVMKERAKFNRRQITAAKKKGEPGRSQTAIEDIEVLGDRIFLFFRSYDEPLIEILEFNSEMRLVAKYVYRPNDPLSSRDFFVRKDIEGLLFYFLDRYEDNRIAVLAEKK